LIASIPFLDLSAMHAEVGAELEEAWRRVTSTGKFIGGEFVDRFENEWAAFCGTAHCVGVSDGTAALELALRALNVGFGDDVIVPANTFIATWEAVVAVGARPVPVDVDPHTLLMNADRVAAAYTPSTAAVIAVHLYGQPVDMDAINRVAARLGIAVIEDAAQAHGATWHGVRAGGLADIGCFSFYPGKNLGAFGDAGAVVTNRLDVAERIRSLSNHGRRADAADRHIYVGGNHRLDGLQAAILSVKLGRLEQWNQARQRVARRYSEILANVAVEPVEIAPGAVSSHHLQVVQVADRDRVRRLLAVAGIATGIHYAVPCHRQAAFAEFAARQLPVAEAAAGRVLSLPMFPTMTDRQVERVGAALRRAVGQGRQSSRSLSRLSRESTVYDRRVAGPRVAW
jgi:dTDP-4-amino-4,6-dideoxygalactose transaminase